LGDDKEGRVTVETKVSTWQSDRAPTEQLQRIFGEVNDRE